ncbi:uncharacterized protein LAESUDRAFT_727521 [Laetiporus sulphureus 93-53]|uniref:Uncharacterized protein n=1 Tax=Laetiporus sulphureus 93-53 TaxID=1314785 RepID=A0A165DIC5_9APHY|nr:uncharacterized protein LAESUDRAFT_727521 [Laetiporus sulphureus 93-53]KZT04947.1 hypothetical protein LAESUDRAFT_727521 [Laetiporus sulphureus 93-53]
MLSYSSSILAILDALRTSPFSTASLHAAESSTSELSLTLDDVINYPDDDQCINQNSDYVSAPITPPRPRSNAMSLDFILRSSASPPRSDAYANRAHGVRLSLPSTGNEDTTNIPAPSSRHFTLSAMSSMSNIAEQKPLEMVDSVYGWVPPNGHAYIVLDAHDSTINTLCALSPRFRVPFAMRPTVTSGPSPLPTGVSSSVLAHFTAAVTPRRARPRNEAVAALHEPPIKQEPLSSVAAALPPHFDGQPSTLSIASSQPSPSMSARLVATQHTARVKLPATVAPSTSALPVSVPVHVSSPAGPTTPTPQSRRRPPPPRGGVAPALARSITHIRMARERAMHLRTQADIGAADGERPRAPSVLGRWQAGQR